MSGTGTFAVGILCLLALVHRESCHSCHTNEEGYTEEWVVTALLGGTAFETAALFSLNAAMGLEDR